MQRFTDYTRTEAAYWLRIGGLKYREIGEKLGLSAGGASHLVAEAKWRRQMNGITIPDWQTERV